MNSRPEMGQVVDAVGAGICIVDLQFRITFQNRLHRELFGDIEGRFCHEAHHAIDHVCEGCGTEVTFKTGKPVSSIRDRVAGGQRRHYEVVTAPILDGSGAVTSVVKTVRDITEKKETEEKLKKSEERLMMAQAIARMGSWEWDMLTNEVTWSDEVFRIRGEVPQSFKPDNKMASETIVPEDRARFYAVVERAIKEKEPIEMEYGIMRRDGKVVTIHTRGEVVYDEHGAPIKIFGTVYDITERKQMDDALRQAVKEKDLLIREINHRVKNNLSVITSLLKLQAHSVEDQKARTMFGESESRVRAMALIHERLYRSDDLRAINFGEYLRSLAHQIMSTYVMGDGKIRLRTEVEDIALDVDSLIPCGLIVNELMTNSIKYAFPDGRGGEIYLGFRREDDGRLLLTVSDDGVGFPEGFAIDGAESMGMMIVDSLTQQLQAEVKIVNNGGAAVAVLFADRRLP